MLQFIIYTGIGAALGAMLGYFGQCTSGACPLTSTWWRGAIYGGSIGLLMYLSTACSPGSSSSSDSSAKVHNLRIINETDFESAVLKSDLPVLVDFYANWCPPCKRLAPMLEELAPQYSNRVNIVKVDVDKSPQLAKKFNITSIPTLIGFKNGNQTFTIVGLPAKGDLIKSLDQLAGK